MQNMGLGARVLIGYVIVGMLLVATVGVAWMAMGRTAGLAREATRPDLAPDERDAALAELDRVSRQGRATVLMAGATGLLMAVLLGVLLARVVERPLLHIAGLLEALEAGEAPDGRLRLFRGAGNRSGLARLAAAVDRLLDLRAEAAEDRAGAAASADGGSVQP